MTATDQTMDTEGLTRTRIWFDREKWETFDFQRQAWDAWQAGKSGLIHSPTGSGKTLAAWLGPVQQAINQAADSSSTPETDPALKVLWITPLRALANDTRNHLEYAAKALDTDITVSIRTGDTPSSQRVKQKNRPPFALVTTPESLSVMLSYPGSDIGLGQLHTVVVDEWHELLGSKRGVQLQLCLARLRRLNPTMRTWGVSATLANVSDAMHTLLGPDREGTLIRGLAPKAIEIDAVLPKDTAQFKWSGHLGLQLANDVIDIIEKADTSLVFTNTRSQAELWFQALLVARPDWLDTIALHHGSLDRKLRETIETRLRNGELTCVVCTSSLDLGVDFSPVDQVLQIGSPKGVARLLQRAGRSGHRPGAVSRIVCVPSNAFELVEIAAVRRALSENRIEAREPPRRSLDVLCQHLVTIAMGTGFQYDEMRDEVRDTHAYSELTNTEWQWVIDFITRGGQALNGYPQYHKVLEVAGIHRVMNREVAARHRMSIGTIASDAQMTIAFSGGRRLGSTEESFIAKLKPGSTFQFAGRQLELVRTKEMTAYVRIARRKSRNIPRWWGTQLPLSTELADTVLDTLDLWQKGQFDTPELTAVAPLLGMQANWSLLPGPDDFLIEYIETPDGYSLYCYPFAGRLAHEGLAMLIAMRLSRTQSITFTLQINDYGFELQSPDRLDVSVELLKPVFTLDNLLDDILESINAAEIAKRRFRDIARIAGLVFDGFPGRPKTARQVQASSGLIFDVLVNYDKDNLLLEQSRREVLEQQLEFTRIMTSLQRLENKRWQLTRPARLTPLAFPLWAESLQSQTVTSESFQQRVEKMLGTLEQATVEHTTPS